MNKNVLITGAAKRVGKSMANHLAAQGWNIAIHFNSSEKEATTLQNELRRNYPDQQFELFKVDLSKSDEVEELIPRIIKSGMSLSLLINNASVFDAATLAKTSTAFLDEQMNVNFKAPFILTRDFANIFSKGIIINVVDTRIVNNKSNFAAYSIAKKALWETTKMAALEFGPNIRVNAIAPGLTLPPDGESDDYLWRLADKIAMKRPGGVDPILKSLDYILDNDYLTGQLLYCDGGENLGLTS